VKGKGFHGEEEKWREKESMMKMGSTVEGQGVNDEVERSGGKRSS
jgi:hypothetical protein